MLLAKFPPTALEFLKIQGLGPKGIALIFEHYRISTIDELERLCQEQKLRVLPRMGAKLEEKVLRSIAQYRQRTGRFLLSSAEDDGRRTDRLPGRGAKASRRSRPPAACGAGARPSAISTCWSQDPPPSRRSTASPPGPGWTRCSRAARTKPAPAWAATACRWTCAPCRAKASARRCNTSPAARITTSSSASARLKLGLTLNEYGLFRLDDNTRVAGVTEEEVYGALGLDWIPPELRENLGEIDCAAEHRLPQLLELAHIRGDIHMHTTETDGRASLEEMAGRGEGQGLRVRRDHRPFQSAGDGERPGRDARRGFRASTCAS